MPLNLRNAEVLWLKIGCSNSNPIFDVQNMFRADLSITTTSNKQAFVRAQVDECD